jgi:hypothetical protein
MIRIRLLKRRRREVKLDPKLDGQCNVPKLGGQWNVKEKHIFTSSHFPPNNLIKPSFF